MGWPPEGHAISTSLTRTLLHHLRVLGASLVHSLGRWVVLQPHFAVLAPADSLSASAKPRRRPRQNAQHNLRVRLPEHLLGYPFLQEEGAPRSVRSCMPQKSRCEFALYSVRDAHLCHYEQKPSVKAPPALLKSVFPDELTDCKDSCTQLWCLQRPLMPKCRMTERLRPGAYSMTDVRDF